MSNPQLEEARIMFVELTDSPFRTMVDASDFVLVSPVETLFEKKNDDSGIYEAQYLLLYRFEYIALALATTLLTLPEEALPAIETHDADNPDDLYQLDCKLAVERSEIRKAIIDRALLPLDLVRAQRPSSSDSEEVPETTEDVAIVYQYSDEERKRHISNLERISAAQLAIIDELTATEERIKQILQGIVLDGPIEHSFFVGCVEHERALLYPLDYARQNARYTLQKAQEDIQMHTHADSTVQTAQEETAQEETW